MNACSICHRKLDTGVVSAVDCGGDCLSCMAEAGDPDCVQQLYERYRYLLSRVVDGDVDEVMFAIKQEFDR